MKNKEKFSAKQKAEKIAIVLLYPFLMLFNFLGKSIKLFNTKNKQIVASVLSLALIVGMVPLASLTALASGDPSQDTEGNYLIKTVEDLTWFASEVNGGNNEINAKLTADIDFGASNTTNWTPIGNVNQNYNGKFDGQNHVVKNLYYNGSDDTYVGLFGVISDKSEIKNVGVVDCDFTTEKNVGGVCGSNSGTISGCYNTGKITNTGVSNIVGGVCSYNQGTISNSYNAGTVTAVSSYVGGICGKNQGTIKNCCNIADLSCTVKNSAQFMVGGICGENSETITNCYNTGNLTVSDSNNLASFIVLGGVCGYNSSGVIIHCYNIGKVTATSTKAQLFTGAVCGLNQSTVGYCYYKDTSETDSIGGTTFKTEEQFKNGEVCYLLNGDQTEINFYQTLGTDNYPVFDNTHKPVYKDGESYKNPSSEPEQDSDGYYELKTVDDLTWFANQVNNVEGQTGINAKLMNDIDFGSGNTTDWTPMGNKDKQYVGKFDGNGKTISHLYYKDITIRNKGLFGYIGENAEIKDLGIYYDFTSSWTTSISLNGICYYNYGTIENCHVTGKLDNNRGTVCGICSYNYGTLKNCYNTSTITAFGSAYGICNMNQNTITNCYNSGDVTGSVYGSTAGLCSTNKGNIAHCYNTGKITSATSAGICCTNSGTLTNCYNTGTITGGDSSTHMIGGICSRNSEKLTNCYNTGNVTGGANSYVGGICAVNFGKDNSSQYNGTITKCYNTGTVTKGTDSNSNRICEINTADEVDIANNDAITDCYYKGTTETDIFDGTTFKSEEQFKSGEVCNLLNGDQTEINFYQNIDNGETNDNLPTFDSTHGVVYKNGDKYSNTKIIEKITLTKEDFTYTAPTNLIYNGKEKSATVKANTGVTCGKITVKYYKDDTLLTSKPIDAGTYTVKIDVAENKNYKAITDLVIDSFIIGQKGLKPSGVTLSEITEQYYTSKKIEPDFTINYGDKVLQKGTDYTVVYGDNTEVGKQVGTIDVTFCGNYSGTISKKFDIIFKPLPADKNAFTVPTAEGENGWYNADFFVTATDGYTVSEDLPTTTDIRPFAKKIKVTFEANNRLKYVYIKDDKDNYYVASFNYSLDKTVPTEPQIEYNESGLKAFLNKITFGLLFKNTVNVNATATDNLTDDVKVEYYAADSAVTDTSAITAWARSLSLTQNSKKIVYAKFTDDAGNYIIANDQGVIVYTDSEVDTESIEFTKTSTDNVTATVTLNGNTIKDIKNGNFTLIKDRAYTVSGNVITFTASYLNILQAGDYTITVSYNPMGEDVSGISENLPSTTEIALTVKKADGSVRNINDLSKTYDKNAVSAPTFDKLGTGNAKIEYKLATDDNSKYSETAPSKAGNYTVRVTVATDENYLEASETRDFTISKRELTITGVTISPTKVYDGNATATITSVGTLSNRISSDNVYFNVGKANYSDKNVGTAKEVTFTGYYISGIDSANYTLKGQPESTTANITKKELTIDLSIKNKQYDGLNTAEFSKTPTLVGTIEKDVVTLTNGTPTFSSVVAKDGINVNMTAFSISGTDANNYNLIQPTAIANIYNEYDAKAGTDYTVNSNNWINKDFVVTAKDGFKISLTNTANGEWKDTFKKTEETANGEITFYVKNVSTNAISKVATERYKIDKTAPVISGIENGGEYYTTQIATVSDKNIKSVTINDKEIKDITKDLTIDGNVDKDYTITATDEAGNETSYTITMKSIKNISNDIEKISNDNVMTSNKDDISKVLKSAQDVDAKNATDNEKKELKEITEKCEKLLETIKTMSSVLDDESIKAIENTTKDSVNLTDKETLNKAKTFLENALKNYKNNYTKEEKEALEARLEVVNDSLTTIDNAEKAIENITKLPANDSIKLSDKATIEAAKDAYNKLSDAEKKLVGTYYQKQLDDAINSIKTLEKQAEDDLKKSPTTGDATNAIPALAVLVISGGLFTTLFANKKRKNSK